MALLFLVIIYIAFISLGLPDTLLGTAWPLMRQEFGVPTESAGMIFMITTGGTIVSSLLSSRVIRKFGTGKVTFFSILLTAAALFGNAIAPDFFWYPILAIPLGLGAGAIDVGLNEFIAEHYEARHMNWLHSFWGLGAMIGPIILSVILNHNGNWRSSYRAISLIQLAVAGLVFLTLPLWNQMAARGKVTGETTAQPSDERKTQKKPGFLSLLQTENLYPILISFMLYGGVEQTLMLWGATYLIQIRGTGSAQAAFWMSFFLGGITVGRFFSGFVSMKLNNTRMIRLGQVLILIGLSLMILPLPNEFALAGIIISGLGCAPIFPSIIHETPARFGKEKAQDVMGIQMASSYIGSTLLPPLLGLVGSHTTMAILPYVLLCYGIVMLFLSEKVNRQLLR